MSRIEYDFLGGKEFLMIATMVCKPFVARKTSM